MSGARADCRTHPTRGHQLDTPHLGHQFPLEIQKFLEILDFLEIMDFREIPDFREVPGILESRHRPEAEEVPDVGDAPPRRLFFWLAGNRPMANLKDPD